MNGATSTLQNGVRACTGQKQKGGFRKAGRQDYWIGAGSSTAAYFRSLFL